MNIYGMISILLSLAVLFGYLNHRFIKLEITTAITGSAILFSVLLIIVGKFGFSGFEQNIEATMKLIPFHNILMNGMLSFLLFAGAMRININHLRTRILEIGILAGIGTVFSAFAVGTLTYYVLPLVGINISFSYCMLFGALISPTDPIAVLATFKELGAPKTLQIMIEGESLFNDGIGIVIFLTIYQLAFSGQPITIHGTLLLFLRQTIGGLIYGALLGYLAYWFMKTVTDQKLEILITLVIVTGGYALAQAISISGPLAMVIAGIFIGNRGRTLPMRVKSIEQLKNFWEIIEEILNVILFLLIGLELLALDVKTAHIIAALYAIPAVLLIRAIVVSAPISFFKKHTRKRYPKGTIRILIWGGLRGALPFALALSLPPDGYRNLLLAMTYAIVAFSIIVQGITIRPLVRFANEELKPPPEKSSST